MLLRTSQALDGKTSFLQDVNKFDGCNQQKQLNQIRRLDWRSYWFKLCNHSVIQFIVWSGLRIRESESVWNGSDQDVTGSQISRLARQTLLWMLQTKPVCKLLIQTGLLSSDWSSCTSTMNIVTNLETMTLGLESRSWRRNFLEKAFSNFDFHSRFEKSYLTRDSSRSIRELQGM